MNVAINFIIDQMGYGLFFYRHVEGHGSYFQQPDGTERFIKPNEYIPDLKPTLQIDQQTAQALLEALQQKGIHPKELTRIEGQYEAQGKHLADLQNMLRCKGLLK